MTFQEYQQAALRTAPTPSYETEDLLHGAATVATEAGELMDIFKKHEFYGKPVDKKHLMEEMGDAMWGLALLCRYAGFTLEDCADANIRKLKVRYPQGFDADKALNRNLDAERRELEKA